VPMLSLLFVDGVLSNTHSVAKLALLPLSFSSLTVALIQDPTCNDMKEIGY